MDDRPIGAADGCLKGDREHNSVPTDLALESVLVPRAFSRAHPGSCFLLDPATNALVVAPDSEVKVRQAFERDLRRFKRSLLTNYLKLQISYFAANSRLALLRFRYVFSMRLSHFVILIHRGFRSW
jgi:hypothetical protein